MTTLLRCAAWYLCLLIMCDTMTAESDPSTGIVWGPPEPWPAASVVPACPAPVEPPRQEWMVVLAVVTAYQPDTDCAHDEFGQPTHRTSTRKSTDIHPYGIAADPSLLPYGTNVIVPEYLNLRFPDKAWPVDDTGGALRHDGNAHGLVHLDLRYRTVWSALKHGKMWMEIHVDVTGWSDAQVARLRRAAQTADRMRRQGVMP
jgi:3D (Asp-Asp-Asp) domain-containing protein